MANRHMSFLKRLIPAIALLMPAAAYGADRDAPILPQLPQPATFSESTIPANGDVNPYGVAFVPRGFPGGGLLHAGDVIVSNFNNSANLQGTGTTIVRPNPAANASPSLFFQDASFPGFSTALGALRRGLVIVGAVPSTDGSGVCNGAEVNVGAGQLLVIDRFGNLRQVLTSPVLLDGPWDLTIVDEGETAQIFVANALSGAVTRLDVRVFSDGVAVEDAKQIASGYTHACAGAAFIAGPTGLAVNLERDVLYVSSTADNIIYEVPDALRRRQDDGKGIPRVTDTTHLHGPLGLTIAPNGDLISAQGDAFNADPAQPSEIVEFDPKGNFLFEFPVDPNEAGAFGLALDVRGDDIHFAAVDDNQNVLDVYNAP